MQIPLTTTQKVFHCLVSMTDDGTLQNPWKIDSIDPQKGLSISTILNDLWTVTVLIRGIHVSKFPHAKLTLSHLTRDADMLIGEVWLAATPLLFEHIRHFVQCIHEGYEQQHAKWLKQAIPNF